MTLDHGFWRLNALALAGWIALIWSMFRDEQGIHAASGAARPVACTRLLFLLCHP